MEGDTVFGVPLRRQVGENNSHCIQMQMDGLNTGVGTILSQQVMGGLPCCVHQPEAVEHRDQIEHDEKECVAVAV